MKKLMFVVTMLASALTYGAEVNQEIVFKTNTPPAVSTIVPQKPLTAKELLEREQVRRQELEMAAKIAAEEKAGKPIIPAAGLTSTQAGVPVTQAPVQTGSKTIHRSPRQGQRLIGATPGRQMGVGRQVIGGSSVPNGYVVTAPAATVPANVNVYVDAPKAPEPPQQPIPAQKGGFWRKVGQATGFGPLFTEYRPPIAEYGATHGAVGASEFRNIPMQTTESVSSATWDTTTPTYYWGGRPSTSKGSSYNYHKSTYPAYYVPEGAVPRSYINYQSNSQRLGPQDYGVPGGSTQTFHLFGRH